MKPDDHWNTDNESTRSYAVYNFWQNLDRAKQAHFEIVGLIKYENIIDIDPEGDIYARCPHVYIKRVTASSFFERSLTYKLVSGNSWGSEIYLPANADKLRIRVFPEHFPDPTERGSESGTKS